jgi:hypothetical protein
LRCAPNSGSETTPAPLRQCLRLSGALNDRTGNAATAPEMLLARLQPLRAVFPLDVADFLSHDDRQALVAGLAGVALDEGNAAGVSIAGVPPMRLAGTWREGFIVNPTRKEVG